MLPAPSRRQPGRPAEAWFQAEATLRLVRDVQRQAIPELTRVFGHGGLFLRPAEAVPEVLSGNMLAHIVSLYRAGDRLDGALVASDARLPIASGSLALVYALFVLESSPDPAALVGEVARVLKPEGTALLLTLNAWAPARLRWGFKGLRPVPPADLGGHLREGGLELLRRRPIGPVWAGRDALDVPVAAAPLADRLRVATLWVARRREPGLTPLRARSAQLAFRPGPAAG